MSTQAFSRGVANWSADFYHAVVAGAVPGYSRVLKLGRNPAVTAPEDLWNGGGTYTGLPAGVVNTVAETLQVFSSNAADTAAGTGARTVQIEGLGSNGLYLAETVTLNGVTPVLTINRFYRANVGTVQSAGSGGVNAGTITARHSTTTANIFMIMPIGTNRTVVGAYTIPANCTGYLLHYTNAVLGGVSGSCVGGIFLREFGGVFVQRQIFGSGGGFNVDENLLGGLSIPALCDIKETILTTSGPNLDVLSRMEFLLRDNNVALPF